MASVFLSYDRDDANKARVIATALEKAGHAVWWDLHVRGGAQFSKVIEEALKAADAVVVLWSAFSIESAWVRDEAAAGRDSGRLVPATIDGATAPMGFRQYQTIDLTDWKRGTKGRGFRELGQALSGLTERGERPPPSAGSPEAAKPRFAPRAWAVALPLAAALALAAYLFWPASSGAAPTVTVLPATSNAMSQALSRDLLAKLGTLQSSNSEALQLVEGGGKAPDLIFKVDASNDGGASKATLMLLSGRNHALLWSGGFEQPSNKPSDLKQQLAYSAANVLDCASEAYGPSGKSLDEQTRRLYLNACGAFTQNSGADIDALSRMFREITQRAPRFEGAWGRLLNAEDDILFTPPFDRLTPASRSAFAADIAAARKVNPDMPEAYIGEADLISSDPNADPLALLDRAVEKNPDDPGALAARAYGISQAGRLKEAITDARRAVQIRPFSPRAQDAYISALMYGGEFDAARLELSKAEALFPGASNLAAAEYRLNLRYGSAQRALDQLHNGDPQSTPFQEIFLKARIDPSPANVAKAVDASRKRMEASPNTGAPDYIQTLAEFGQTDELIDFLLKWQRIDEAPWTGVLFRPTFHNFWHDPRSMQVAAHFGFTKYWRRSEHWPDFCTWPDLPYDCKKEAAKLKA